MSVERKHTHVHTEPGVTFRTNTLKLDLLYDQCTQKL